MSGSALPRRLAVLAALAGALAAPAAQAIEYRSIATPAILYDSPSDKGRKVGIAAPGTPVEVIVALERWIKVRDPSGAINWVERRQVADKHTVMVTAARASIRGEPSASGVVSFEAAKDVVLEIVEAPKAGWVKVRHADGAGGYLRVSDAWGL